MHNAAFVMQLRGQLPRMEIADTTAISEVYSQ